MKQNGAKLELSLWLYSVHGQNSEIIHFLEEKGEGIVRNDVPMVPTDDFVLRSNDEVWFIADNVNTFDAEDELKNIF